MEYSKQTVKLIQELTADILNQSPTWFSDRATKPPNHAIEDGVKREAESRDWYEIQHLKRAVPVTLVGFCMHESYRFGCSPDSLVGEDGILELKNPQQKTQARYVDDPQELYLDYRCQCVFQLLATGRQWVDLVSYCPPLPPVVVPIVRDEFTTVLQRALIRFLIELEQAKSRLGLAA